MRPTAQQAEQYEQHDIPVDHRMMTAADLRVMLDQFTALDGHPRLTPAELRTWSMAAEAGQWTRAQVVAATMHLTLNFSGFRVMPAHFTEAIAEVRAQVRGLWDPPPPPRELADEPRREITWRRRACQDFMDRAMLALAMGEPLEQVPMISSRFAGQPELPPAAPGGAAETRAREAMTAFLERTRWPCPAGTAEDPGTTEEGGGRRARPPRRPSVVDPVRADRARKELAATRPGALPEETAAPTGGVGQDGT